MLCASRKPAKGSASGSGTESLFRMDHGCRLAGLVTVRQNISLVEPDEGDNQRLIRLSSEATFSPSGREESGRTPSEVIAHHRGKNGYSIWPHKPDSVGSTPAPASNHVNKEVTPPRWLLIWHLAVTVQRYELSWRALVQQYVATASSSFRKEGGANFHYEQKRRTQHEQQSHRS